MAIYTLMFNINFIFLIWRVCYTASPDDENNPRSNKDVNPSGARKKLIFTDRRNENEDEDKDGNGNGKGETSSELKKMNLSNESILKLFLSDSEEKSSSSDPEPEVIYTSRRSRAYHLGTPENLPSTSTTTCPRVPTRRRHKRRCPENPQPAPTGSSPAKKLMEVKQQKKVSPVGNKQQEKVKESSSSSSLKDDSSD